MTERNYRICTNCPIHHYENCNTCFGFGVYTVERYPGEYFPVSAGAAHERTFRGPCFPCPECGSTPNGLPDKSTLTTIHVDKEPNGPTIEVDAEHVFIKPLAKAIGCWLPQA